MLPPECDVSEDDIVQSCEQAYFKLCTNGLFGGRLYMSNKFPLLRLRHTLERHSDLIRRIGRILVDTQGWTFKLSEQQIIQIWSLLMTRKGLSFPVSSLFFRMRNEHKITVPEDRDVELSCYQVGQNYTMAVRTGSIYDHFKLNTYCNDDDVAFVVFSLIFPRHFLSKIEIAKHPKSFAHIVMMTLQTHLFDFDEFAPMMPLSDIMAVSPEYNVDFNPPLLSSTVIGSRYRWRLKFMQTCSWAPQCKIYGPLTSLKQFGIHIVVDLQLPKYRLVAYRRSIVRSDHCVTPSILFGFASIFRNDITPLFKMLQAFFEGRIQEITPTKVLLQQLTCISELPQMRCVLPKLHIELTPGQRKTYAFMKYREHVPIEQEFVYSFTDSWHMNLLNYGQVESKHYGAIIANCTGTGKTLSSLLWASESKGCIIICPDVLVSHWANEIEKHQFCNFRVIESEKSARALFAVNPVKVTDKLVISASTFRRFALTFNYGFVDVIIDEAHQLIQSKKLLHCLQQFKRRNTWLLTATPYVGMATLVHMLCERKLQKTLNEAVFIRRVICQTPLECKKLEVKTEIISCPMEPQEVEFYENVKNIVRETWRHNHFQMCYLNRFFRILERVTGGGSFEYDLILAVLKRTFSFAASRKRGHPDHMPLAPVRALADSKDDCAICLSEFIDPVQLGCAHVLCLSCLRALEDTHRKQCPLCRRPITHQYQAHFENSESKPVMEQKEIVEPKHLLVGDKGSLQFHGKFNAFRQHLAQWILHRTPEDQLLVYVKDEIPAQRYLSIAVEFGISVQLTGFNVSKVSVMDHIERFKQHAYDMLIISTKYCAGFDLICASEVWQMNTDLNTAKMEQSRGRVMRLSVQHKTVTVKPFLYRNTFDEFIYKFQHLGKINYTKGNLLLFEYFLHRDTVDHKAKEIYQWLKKVFNNKIPHMVANGNHITVGNCVKLNLNGNNLKIRQDNANSWSYSLSMDDVLCRPIRYRTWIQNAYHKAQDESRTQTEKVLLGVS